MSLLNKNVSNLRKNKKTKTYKNTKYNYRKQSKKKIKKYKRLNKQKGGALNYIEDLNKIGKERMDFFKEQKNKVSFDNVADTVNKLYRTYKYEIAKGGLTSAGRRLDIIGETSTDVTSDLIPSNLKPSNLIPSDMSVFTNIYKKVEVTSEFFADNCYIVLNTLHGIMKKPNDFKVVPSNTLVCFISGLDYLNVTSSSMKDMSSLLDTLNYEDFAYLFKYQMNITDLINNNVEVSESSRRTGTRYSQYDSYLYSNCLENSMWYYPGQLYPNIVNSCEKDDILARGYDYYSFSYPKNKPDKLSDSKFPNHLQLKTDFFSKGNTKFEKDLSDLVDYKKSINKNIKLVIAISCRPIIKQNKKDYFQLEVFTYHLNKHILAKAGESVTYDVKIELNTKCSQESGKQYYLKQEDFTYNFFNNEVRNDNYNHMVPQLYDIMDKVKNGNFETRDLRILAFQSFTKLYKFISQIKEDERNKYKNKLIIKLVRENYDMLSRNFINFVNIFHYTSYIYQEIGKSYISSEIFDENMLKLNELFDDTMIKAGLDCFIFSNRFRELYNSSNRTKNILNITNAQRMLGNFINIGVDEPIRISEIEKGRTSLEVLCQSENFIIDKISYLISNLTLSYINKLIFDTNSESTLIKFNLIFRHLPFLQVLDLFGITDNSITFENDDYFPSLVFIKIVQCKIKIDKFDKFPNLKKIQIENNSEVNELYMNENKHLQEVILSDLDGLSTIFLGETGQEIHTLNISNCFSHKVTDIINIKGKIKNFILQESKLIYIYPENISYFKVEKLSLINCTIVLQVLKKICTQSKTHITSPKYINKLKLHFTTIIDYQPTIKKVEEEFISFLQKKIKFLDIYQPYINNNTDPNPLKIYNDLKLDSNYIKKLSLNSNKKLKISKNTISGPLRPQDLDHITLID